MSGGVGNFFNGGANSDYQDEIQKALSAMQGYYGQAQGALQPWQQANNAYQNPQQFYQQMMQGYTESPQAQQAVQAGTQAANAAGAANGMAGSSAEQAGLQKYGQNILAADQSDWFNRMAGTYGNYVEGERGIGQDQAGLAMGMGTDTGSIYDQAANAMAQGDEAGMKDLGQFAQWGMTQPSYTAGSTQGQSPFGKMMGGAEKAAAPVGKMMGA